MARYQMVFRNGRGDHVMLVDDPSGEGEALAYLHQPLEIGATIKTNGDTWTVIEDSNHDGVRRFTCDPASSDPNRDPFGPVRRRLFDEAIASAASDKQPRPAS